MRKKNRSSLRWMAQTARPQLFSLAVLTAGTGLYAACGVLFALLSREILDAAVSGSTAGMVRAVIGLLILVIGQMALHLGVKLLEEHVSAKLEAAFRGRVFRALLGREYAEVSAYHSGELLERLFGDVGVVSSGVVGLLPAAVGLATRLVCAVAVLFLIDAGFTGIMILAGGAIVAVSYLFRERIKNLHKEMQQRHGRLRAFLQESIENLTVTKVFRAEEQMAAEADALQGDYFSARMARRRMSVLANAGFGFLFQAGYLAALAYGGLGLLNGSLTYGSLLAILQLIGQLQSPLSGLSGIIPQYYSMIASCERMQEIEQLPEEKAGEEIDPGALYKGLKEIVFDRVSFGYGRERVLDTFCCTIPKGGLTAVLGRSGRGKSTLLKLLLGIYAAENGEVFLRTAEDDVPITSAMRGMFAYVPQGNLLFSGTILENILFVRGDAPEEEIREALRISGADAFVDALPQGVHTKLGEKGLGLSEGQVQRLAIARALLSGAPILLLDEATSALDAHTERELLERLCALETHTIVMISHKKAVLEVCDHCIDID